MDYLLTAAPHYLPNRLYTLFPHPAQEPNEKRRYIAMVMSRYTEISYFCHPTQLLLIKGTVMCPVRSCETCILKVGVHSTVYSPLFLLAGPLGKIDSVYILPVYSTLLANHIVHDAGLMTNFLVFGIFKLRHFLSHMLRGYTVLRLG